MGDHTVLRNFFGCEIEIPLKREDLLKDVNGIEKLNKEQREREAVEQLVDRLKEAGLDAVYESGKKQYNQWVVGRDPTIGEFSSVEFQGCAHSCPVILKRGEELLPVEVRSPPLDVDRPELYAGMKIVWEVIKPFQVERAYWWKACSFHIHFSHHEPLVPVKDAGSGLPTYQASPNMNRYPLSMAQKVCCSVNFLERALMQLLPWQPRKLRVPGKWKHDVQHTKRNKIDDNLASCFEGIMSSNTNEDLGGKFCPTRNKYWKLNVRGYNKEYVTMEMRIFPPVRNYEDVCAWIYLWKLYLNAASRISEESLRDAAAKKISCYEAVFGCPFEPNSGKRESWQKWEELGAADRWIDRAGRDVDPPEGKGIMEEVRRSEWKQSWAGGEEILRRFLGDDLSSPKYEVGNKDLWTYLKESKKRLEDELETDPLNLNL
ncbi:hypothetical protein GGR57DRAFT_501873 [Xylariaceae sp. FL1272]|nr:hypothetical protein GGR57DRAFT_501873 [Xylariaceae sp. FL1272]